MTIITTQSRITYMGDNVTTLFPIPFEFFLNSDISSVKTAVGGVVIPQTQNVDYTLSGAGVIGGGSATKTTPLLIGEIQSFFLNPPITQQSHYISNAPFPAATLENDIDRRTQTDQRLADLITRSITAPDSDLTPSLVLPSAALRVGKFLTFDSAGSVSMASAVPISALPFPPTPAEISGGVVPTNGNYLPGDLRRYGADPTGSTDSTGAIVIACSCNQAVYVPPGTFKFSTFTMPTTFGFVLYGARTASVLQQTGAGIKWPSTGTNPCGYYEGYIADLTITATGATGHCINTQYAGGVTLEGLFFGNLPIGFDAIHLDGNAASTTDKYSHDVRLKGIQIYSNTAGNAGISASQYVSDFEIDGFVMNGNNLVPYGFQGAAGCTTGAFSNCHPYNNSTNIVNIAAGGTGFTFSNCIFDNVLSGLGDSVVLSGLSNTIFDACWFEAIKAGRNGLTLNNCGGTTVSACRWDGAVGSGYAINETGTSDNTEVLGGSIIGAANFNNPIMNLIGAHSVAKNVAGYNTAGQQITFFGCTTATVAAASTVFLGANGAQAAAANTYFQIPLPAGMSVLNATVTWDTQPGAGTYTCTLQGNGATMTAASGSANPQIATGAVNSTTINVAPGAAQFVAGFNRVGLRIVTSAGAPAANFQVTINCIG